MKPPRIRPGQPNAHGQCGVYTIEFAFVFLLFFALVYGIICYGILFTFRFGLQNAAEDGARAALQYQPDLSHRTDKAIQVAHDRTSGWLPVTPVIDAKVCQLEGSDGDRCTAPICDSSQTQHCQVVVTVTASGMNSILPMLNFALPDTLAGKASMLLDGRTL